MPRVSPAFWIDRLTLQAGVSLTVLPPRDAGDVTIGNATTGDLKVYTQPDDDAHYLVIATGYERLLSIRPLAFPANTPVFWLKAVQSGDVVLIWV